MLSPNEQVEYILLENTNTKYDVLYGWKPGIILKRISIWYGSNGCGRDLKQAYFVPADSNNLYGHIAWNDHVKEITDQLEFEL
ncbi:MAG: hypothetical protein K0S80_2343 [Neobacillus sp.]|nr:hypothetical protein [Neobacillus sp.]